MSDFVANNELPMGVTSSEEPPTTSIVPDLCASETSQGDVHLEEEMDDKDVETSLTTPKADPPTAESQEPDQVQRVTFSKGPAQQKIPNICGDSSSSEDEDKPCCSKKLITVKGSASKKSRRRDRSYSRSPSESDSDESSYPTKMSKMSAEIEEALVELVENTSLTPAAVEETWAEPRKIVHRREDNERHRDAQPRREYEHFVNHPFAGLLKAKLTPVESPYYNTDLNAEHFERIPASGYSGLVQGLFPEVIGGVPRSLRSKVTILEAVGPRAIESFRSRNQYSGLETRRENKQPLRTMPVNEYASQEELTKTVHGLVFDGPVAPVLYRVKTLFGNGAKLETVHFRVALPDRLDLLLITIDPYAINIATGKRGIDITKMMVGDLIWVYTLAVSVKFGTSKLTAPQTVEQAYQVRQPTVWRVWKFALVHRELKPTLGFVVSIAPKAARICMDGHRQLVSLTPNRMENPEEFQILEADSFIVAPFRARQLDYIVFACEPKNETELFSYIADIPHFSSPAPVPFDVRRTSDEHRELVESKRSNFELFNTSPGEVLGFLEPLYSTSCGAISAAIADATDSAAHPTVWRSPDLNGFPILACFRIPIGKKSGWAVGSSIRGAFQADFLDGQVTQIEMSTEYFQVTARLQTGPGVRFRTYLLNSRSRSISVATSLNTMEERANPVLKMSEAAVLSNSFHPGTLGWKSARALIAGDIELEGFDAPQQEEIVVNVAGSPVQLNPHQVGAVNTFNKDFPIMVVDSAYGAGKSLCTAVMASEAVSKGEVILVAAVQNSALYVIGSKIAQLQSENIRPVRYINDIMASDPTNRSPYALNTLMENFHETHRHLLSDRLFRKFKRFSESRKAMREFMFTGTERYVVSNEHKQLLLLEENSSDQVKILTAHFLKLYKPNVYLCTVAAALNLTSKRGLWRTIGNTWKRVLLDEASMIPEAALMAMLSRFQKTRFTRGRCWK